MIPGIVAVKAPDSVKPTLEVVGHRKLAQARERLEALAERLRDSSSALMSDGNHRLATERDKDADALDLFLDEDDDEESVETSCSTCPTCGV